MTTYTLKDPRKMGESDPKYGQTYWANVEEAQMPVMFNLTNGNPQDGQKVSFEERTIKESKKGVEYMRLSKTKLEGAQQALPVAQKSAYQPRDDKAIRAQWAIGQALSKFDKNCYEATDENRTTLLDNISDFAIELFNMVNKVKSGEIKRSPEPAPQPPVDDVHPYDEEAPINLDDIPF